MKFYILTNKKWEDIHGRKWGPGVENLIPDEEFWKIYPDPLLAIFFNRVETKQNLIQSGIIDPVLWEGERDNIRLKTIRQIELPMLTTEHYIRFGILCVLEVYREKPFVKWAEDWLSGKDKSIDTAKAVLRWTEEEKYPAKVLAAAEKEAEITIMQKVEETLPKSLEEKVLAERAIRMSGWGRQLVANSRRAIQPGVEVAATAATYAIRAALATSWKVWLRESTSKKHLVYDAATTALRAAGLKGQNLDLIAIARKAVPEFTDFNK